MSFNLAFNTHDDLVRNIEKFLRETLTVQGKKNSLNVVSIQMPVSRKSDDLKAQKNSIIQGLSYSNPVKATLELKEGSKVLNRATIKVLDLPQVTVRGTYVVGGNEYHFPLQKRLIPGIYTREHEDGKISAWFNSKKGRNITISLRPKYGDFVMEIESSLINLYAILIGLGIKEAQLRKYWGAEVLNTNRRARGAQSVLQQMKKLYEKLHYSGDDPIEEESIAEYRRWILKYFSEKSEFDADNVKITLNKSFSKTSPEALLYSTIKILTISRGEGKEDNKESLVHNNIFDLSDFIIERMNQRQYKSRINRTLKRNVDRYDKVTQVVQRDIFQTPLESTFTQTSLGRMPKQNNPMDMASSFSELTVMGEGGIMSGHAVTRDVRSVDPTHLGFIDPAHTPEGSNIGTSVHIASGVKKVGKTLTTPVTDIKTNQKVMVNPRQFFGSVVAFAEFFIDGKFKPESDGMVKAIHKGDIQRVKPAKVKYAMQRASDMFGVNTLAMPFLSHNNGTRVMTGVKMQTQAKPLKNREKPLILSAISESSNSTVEEIMGKNSLPKSPVSGVVKTVSKDKVVITDSAKKDHEVGIPSNFWLNENNYVDVKVKVKKGDKVKKGEILGDSNYTVDGTLALGTNLRAAYVPFKGYNHEDGTVISESGAEKLTSMHAYQKLVPVQDNEETEKKKFVAYFPAIYSKEQLDKLDDNGVVKKGAKVKKGDPIVLKMRKVEEDTVSKKLQNISRLLVQDFRDTTVVWGKSVIGTVEEVHLRKSDIMAVIKTEEKAKVGDKLVARYGNKATITSVLSDAEMPKDKDGNAMDILLDPSGVPGRMNLGQILETTASGIAEKTGKPYIARPFSGDHTNKLTKELKKHGLKDHGTLMDGKEEIDGVLIGKQYFMKLEHQVDKKLSARGAGPEYAYSMSGQPSRGSGQSGRAIGLGELYSLLSHGAYENLSEMYTFKGDKQLDSWRAIENGTFMPPPQVPASSERFVGMLKGMGVNLKEEDSIVKMVPFLDKDIKKLSSGEIKDATTLRAKDLKEEKGGLFDLKTTGGVIGEKWSHVKLREPVPHPTFEKSILDVTHLKKQEFLDIMAGTKGVFGNKVVKSSTPGSVAGGNGIKKLLKTIDTDSRLKEVAALAPKKKGSDLNKLHREARVLKNFKDNKIKLEEMVVEYLPIMPPKFRPIVELPNGDINVSDVNEHYRAAILMNNQMKDYENRPGLKEEADKVRANLYTALSGAMGMSMGLVDKPDVKGIAATIAGSNPKSGFYQSKILKKRQEASGTAVVGPEPNLDMDQIGIPENMAWEVFKPHAVKELKSSGLTSMKAREEIENRSKFARDALVRVMEDKMVIANRAPTLHRWGMMAFKPTLITGSAVKLPVEVLGGYNADFDGDTFGIHVPATPEAIREAKTMLPSNNLYKPGEMRATLSVSLGKEYMMGLYKLTRNVRTTSNHYTRPEMAIREAMQKKIRWDDIISVRLIGRTTAGKLRVMKKVPAKLRDYQMTLTKDNQESFLARIEKESGKDALKAVINDWKNAGRLHVYESGTSFILSDLQMLTSKRKSLYRKADMEASAVRRNKRLSKEQRDKKLIDIYSKVDSKIMGMAAQLPSNSTGKGNNISDMVNSGMSKPGPNQLKQLVGNLGLMLDHRQNTMPEPVRGNYAEGLSSSDFFQHMYAQRKGMIDKSQEVSGPGMLSKELTNSATRQKVTKVDCGTRNGKQETVDSHIVDRVLASPAAGVMGGTLIDQDILHKLQKAKLSKVSVRSILTCEAGVGICAKCFGYDEQGRFPSIGKNIGISEIQAITERSVQLPMKAFHTGGVATADKGLSNAFDRALQVFRMPENIKDKATLATVSGVVTSIRKSGYGGNIVTIGPKDHKVGKKLTLKVKLGDRVKKGDPISSGVIKHQELLKLTNIETVQSQMRDDLQNAFGAAGVHLHKRTYEVPVKMLTEQVRVRDPGDCKKFTAGDYTTLAKVRGWNVQNVNKKQIAYTSELPGSQYAPLRTEDWAQRMALGRIKQTLEEGVGMGYASNRKGVSPFADLALGPKTKLK